MSMKANYLELNIRAMDDEVLDPLAWFYETADGDSHQAFADALTVVMHMAVALKMPSKAVATLVNTILPVIAAVQEENPDIFGEVDGAVEAAEAPRVH